MSCCAATCGITVHSVLAARTLLHIAVVVVVVVVVVESDGCIPGTVNVCL